MLNSSTYKLFKYKMDMASIPISSIVFNEDPFKSRDDKVVA